MRRASYRLASGWAIHRFGGLGEAWYDYLILQAMTWYGFQ